MLAITNLNMHHRIWDFVPGKGTCPGHQPPMRARSCWNGVWRCDTVFLSDADGSSSPTIHETALAGARAGAARKEGIEQLSIFLGELPLRGADIL